jgi:hypothetical protein
MEQCTEPSPQEHLTLKITIGGIPTYEFYFECQPQATVRDLLRQLQIYYYDDIARKGLHCDP